MNPYLLPRPAIVSFSGGRTSGFMLSKIIEAFGGTLPSDVIPVFANTGLEDERTYAFVADVSRRWCPVTVVERARGPEGRKDWFRVVSIEAAARHGEPFTELNIDKSFLPNPVMRMCTANLKIKPMAHYARSLGWTAWTVAVGLRADEPRRVAKLNDQDGKHDGEWERLAPLAEAGATIADVTAFWSRQPFDLAFPSGDNTFGNCVGCFLKGRGRLDTIARAKPEALAWWVAEEARMGSTFRKDRPSYAGVLKAAQGQPLLFADEETLPCDCTG